MLSETRRPVPMMMAHEVDHEGFDAKRFQFLGSQRSMTSVLGESAAKRKAQSDGDRREDPADRPEPGVSLADVVENGRSDEIRAIRLLRRHIEATFQPVALIGIGLGGEDVDLPISQPRT